MTGEYGVIHGAKAIAFPLRLGQKMIVRNARGSDLVWKSLDDNGDVWFDAQISLYDFGAVKTSDDEIAKKLQKILKSAVRLNSEFLSTWSGFKVETQLEFPLNWGLGSSSSLIALVAEWAGISPFDLHFQVSNGSGYDIACARADGPLSYQITDDEIKISDFDFEPNFVKNLYLVYLNVKQSSEKEVEINSDKFKSNPKVIDRITEISNELIKNKSFVKFVELLGEHEELVSKVIGKETVQSERFKNFNGLVKSLGAWGGDFALAASSEGDDYVKKYFNKNGYHTIHKFEDIVL